MDWRKMVLFPSIFVVIVVSFLANDVTAVKLRYLSEPTEQFVTEADLGYETESSGSTRRLWERGVMGPAGFLYKCWFTRWIAKWYIKRKKKQAMKKAKNMKNKIKAKKPKI
ncbi:uncharacterized protein LOC111046865 [Nilaparvata lugens]|uniref:uncharacterized protein LOC111046865 n=1 Tax=Nilaparvata lugens TaxID=108931 RepID=UPI000B996759|nr:uncharacterized protein LOC111046865 [Nilaparvata lugens]